MRLDKFIASQGKYSRSDVKRLIKQKAVTVDGEVAIRPEEQVEPEKNEVAVLGEKISYKEHIYIMLNKPQGVVSATEDESQKTVIDLIPAELKRNGLFPAGRLDADTTGFVLVTDDGDFAHRILSPKNHIQKTYIAELADPVTDEDINELESGILLKDGSRCLPAEVRKISDKKIEIKICEGKYHQIKRMFAARGNRVEKLNRSCMGKLEIDETLQPGECREISREELAQIEKRE